MTDRQSFIERILYGIETRVEHWREESKTRQAEVEANRSHLWAEAAEREKFLKEAISEEEGRERLLEDVTKEQRLVFVVHSEESGAALKDFTAEQARLVDVIPVEGSYRGESGIRGSWLVYEPR